MKKLLERDIENALGRYAKRLGCIYYKFTSPARRSVPDRMDDEQLRGLQAMLRLCIFARVLLTTNDWVKAGLVNSAASYVRGFMFP